MMTRINRSFKKVGNEVIIKNTIADTPLSIKEILETIANLESSIGNCLKNIESHKSNIEKAKEGIIVQEENKVLFEEDLKGLKKFYDWAYDAQLSKLKNLISEIKDEAFNLVVGSYKYDNGISEEQNNLHKYRQYQQKVATNKVITEAVAWSVISQFVFEDSLLDNPFK